MCVDLGVVVVRVVGSLSESVGAGEWLRLSGMNVLPILFLHLSSFCPFSFPFV